MIFVIGLILYVLAKIVAALMERAGVYHRFVYRTSDLIVVIPGITGMVLMFVSLCTWLWALLP